MAVSQKTPKYRQVYSTLRRDIQSGRLKGGDRLPSEADLVRQFGASRITVGRAVRELQTAGLVDRKAGSGTFVKTAQGAGGLSFGLLIPDLGETEIFEPICQGMMASPLARAHALLWGSLSGAGRSKEERAWQLCRQYIERQVSGVFFAPLELSDEQDDVNRRIAHALDEARIPIVLLDRTVVPYPQRGHHDLAREAGYREALYAWDAPVERTFVHRFDPADTADVQAMMDSTRPDAIVCANDRTAARVMHTLLGLNVAIPGDVRLVGIDDLEYASLLPVPLTTLRQPTSQLGDTALAAMLDRVSRIDLPIRDILLHCELIVRDSCGACT
jgi:GntR family transcriptional regulator of arabinose operon